MTLNGLLCPNLHLVNPVVIRYALIELNLAIFGMTRDSFVSSAGTNCDEFFGLLRLVCIWGWNECLLLNIHTDKVLWLLFALTVDGRFVSHIDGNPIGVIRCGRQVRLLQWLEAD